MEDADFVFVVVVVAVMTMTVVASIATVLVFSSEYAINQPRSARQGNHRTDAGNEIQYKALTIGLESENRGFVEDTMMIIIIILIFHHHHGESVKV
mmetsp:Transcript_15993/g.25021  ORF Transcript_15993/g.25021 Transcript_15993/m.25021 type:complete len:96 (+) Transcript_15993:93-380(+)